MIVGQKHICVVVLVLYVRKPMDGFIISLHQLCKLLKKEKISRN